MILIVFISENESLLELKKKFKKDKDNIFGLIFPKKIKSSEKILVLKDFQNNFLSFIWFGIYENNEIGKFLHTNCSYTFTDFRSKGYNRLLRLELENYAKSIGILIITSKPLEGSKTIQILFNLDYCVKDNYFIKKIQ